ncbi:MAG: protein-disulfide reductase DsbD [Gammaproteobacteria bacterium]|nr:protein-disulfide reductase DsbD [Gammaproteobacteria bacterium]
MSSHGHKIFLRLLMTALLLPVLWLTHVAHAEGIFDKLGNVGRQLGIGANDGNPFLPPEKAFIFTAEVKDDHTVTARWDIADGYYLYRNKFNFEILNPATIQAGTPSFPQGKQKKDDTFGLMEVYFHEVNVELPLQRNSNSAATNLTLKAVYQGCAEAGFCYPPQTQEITLSLPEVAAAATTQTPASNTSNFVSEQDRYARSLAEKSLALNMLMFFGLGLLLCFTPCVFPMIPILSSIIAGQGSGITTRRAFLLSLTYVLAMAATYTAAGVAAGTLGANLQAVFQNPWILGSFAMLFVVLSLSMFGFYELQIPSSWQGKLTSMSNRQQGGSYFGVGIMGVLSALIVGPCVAAPLAGALIYIGQSGDALLGGAALFALSLGMGAPLLVFGTSAGKLLPKAGAWMNAIKAVFGVMLLSVAIWMIERIIPAAVALLLWGALFIVCAVYLGALERLQPEASGWHKLWKGVGLIFFVYGGVLLVGATSGGKDIFQPLQGLSMGTAQSSPAKNHLQFQRIKGLTGLEQALQQARVAGKPVMLDFYADWCISCKEMEKSTFSNTAVQAILADTVLLQADVTLNDAEDQALLKRFGLFGPPSILFFDTQGNELRPYRLVGFLEPAKFEQQIRGAFKK